MNVKIYIPRHNITELHTFPYEIGDVVNVIRPGNVLSFSAVNSIFGKDEWLRSNFNYPNAKFLSENSWKIVDVKCNFTFCIVLLLVNRNNSHVVIEQDLDYDKNSTPIKVVRKAKIKEANKVIELICRG